MSLSLLLMVNPWGQPWPCSRPFRLLNIELHDPSTKRNSSYEILVYPGKLVEGWLFLLKEIEIEMQIEKRKGKFEESEGDTVSEGISA